MDSLIPWPALEGKLSKYYPKKGNGRPPYPFTVMLRVHCMQLFYNLSDPMMEPTFRTLYFDFWYLMKRHGNIMFSTLNKLQYLRQN
ncbi:MAG: transposase [Ghiorsea sp.]|nr:transposase [Ghiorsea sp.]